MKELSNEELDRIAAIEVLGWVEIVTQDDYDAAVYNGYGKEAIYHRDHGWDYFKRIDTSWLFQPWHPTTCRNQSRMVVEAAMKSLQEEYGESFEALSAEMDAVCESRGLVFSSYFWISATPRQEVEAAILAVRASKGEEPT